jgi:hypothetical protein
MYEGAANLPLQQHYPGQTVADQSQQTQQSLGMAGGLARGGANDPRTNQWNQTLQGDYLYGGQGFNAALDAAHNKIAPMVQGQFASGGRYGGGLAQEAETSALADAFAGQYGQERQNQMYAMGMESPAYTDAAMLGQVGSAQDAFQQANMDDQAARWNFAQQAPYDRLAAQNSVIQAGYPGQQQVSESFGPPSLMDLVGVDAKTIISNPFDPTALPDAHSDRIGGYGDI